MSHLRDVRRTAAARTIGERHPWSVLYGPRLAGLIGLAVLAVGAWLGLRWVWGTVSHWFASSPSPAVVPVSHTVSLGPVSWVPWWGWVIAVAVLVVLIRWGIPRLRFKAKYGIWP